MSDSSYDVVEKLDKVADSLETATSHLAGVVTQQQLDLLRERVAAAESDIVSCKETVELTQKKVDDVIESLDSFTKTMVVSLDDVEKDFSGLRALSLTGFALGTITLIGLILCAVYL